MHLLFLIRNQYFIKEYLYKTLRSYILKIKLCSDLQMPINCICWLCVTFYTHTPIYIFVCVNICIFVLSRSVVSDSLEIHGL